VADSSRGYALPVRTTRDVWTALTSGPSYPPEPADLRTVSVVGLRLPVRATVAVTVVTLALLLDYSRTFLPDDLLGPGRTPGAMAATAIERLILFGLIPFAVVVLGFRDRPDRYGLTLGEWRWGSVLTAAGCLVMTPIVLWFATLPEVRAFYADAAAPLGPLLATDAIDLTATEFAFRGFLMLTLVRLVGPFGVVVATMPFVFAHLGKPELELFSTLGGGLVYGWLAWRTRSIVWGSIGHTCIVTLLTLAAAAGL
jgi:membrane protease YdiL (CAAX protease family)